MNQYSIVKCVYAHSVADAIARESEGFVVNAVLNDVMEEEEYRELQSKRKAIPKFK